MRKSQLCFIVTIFVIFVESFLVQAQESYNTLLLDENVRRDLVFCPSHFCYFNISNAILDDYSSEGFSRSTFFTHSIDENGNVIPEQGRNVDLNSDGLYGSECDSDDDCLDILMKTGCYDYSKLLYYYINEPIYMCQPYLNGSGRKFCTISCTFLGGPSCFKNPNKKYNNFVENEGETVFGIGDSSLTAELSPFGIYQPLVALSNCQRYCIGMVPCI